jgi:hypothetical protein
MIARDENQKQRQQQRKLDSACRAPALKEADHFSNVGTLAPAQHPKTV